MATSLDAALRQFEIAESNLLKLEKLWPRILALIPGGCSFGSNPEFEQLCREYREFLHHMPAIDGFTLTDKLQDLNAIAQGRFDAMEIDEIDYRVSVEEAIMDPKRELDEYRFRLEKKRRELVRTEMLSQIANVDRLLPDLQVFRESDGDYGRWEELSEAVAQIEVLLGSAKRPPRWGDLRRHLRFAMPQDMRDIIEHDWPDARPILTKSLFTENEPLPVDVADLGSLTAMRPSGPVRAKIEWSRLTDDDFERLLYRLISSTSGYENVQWLMKTKAPDRGRDISADHVQKDPLSGTLRSRVIVQCKHWLSNSVGMAEISVLKDQVKLWEPPIVNVLIIATSGRFSADAVQFAEQHNEKANAPRLLMWPESHLESLLRSRPDIIAEFSLR